MLERARRGARSNADHQVVELAVRGLLGFDSGSTKLPAAWRPWQKPKSVLPIDERVSALIAKKKMRDRGQFDGLGKSDVERCPYAFSRRTLAHAALLSDWKAGDEGSVREPIISAIRRFKGGADSLSDQLSRSITELNKLQLRDDYSPAIDGELCMLAEKAGPLIDLLLGSQIALKKFLPLVQNAYRRQTQNQGNIWRIQFVTTLGFLWRRLTGRDPSPGPSFQAFVEAGWETLSSEEDYKWDRAIRTACKRNKGDWVRD